MKPEGERDIMVGTAGRRTLCRNFECFKDQMHRDESTEEDTIVSQEALIAMQMIAPL